MATATAPPLAYRPHTPADGFRFYAIDAPPRAYWYARCDCGWCTYRAGLQLSVVLANAAEHLRIALRYPALHQGQCRWCGHTHQPLHTTTRWDGFCGQHIAGFYTGRDGHAACYCASRDWVDVGEPF